MLAAIPAAAASPSAPSAPSTASAPRALNENGPIAASAQASLLTLDVAALSPSLLPQTNIDLAPSAARAASDQDLDADKAGGQRSAAVGGITYGSNLLGAPLDLQSNGASAPASEVNEDTLIPLDLAPLLTLPIINSRAEANWVNDVECVSTETPMSLANQTAADISLLGDPGESVVDLNTAPGEGAVDTEVSTRLVGIDGEGDARAVQATARTTITDANVLNGLAGPGSIIEVDVAQAPSYVVQASGLPGGASVTGDRPVVSVNIAGEPLITLDDSNPTAEATLTDLVLGDLLNLDAAGLLSGPDGLLADLGLDALIPIVAPIEAGVQAALGALQPVVRLSIPYEETVAADGTSASVEGSVLRIEVLPPAALGALEPLAGILNQILEALVGDITDPLLEVNLAPIAASVTAPSGGIDCGGDQDNPLRELNKHASATEVAPGGVFEYNIAVPNRGPCALTDVVVTDTVTGPGEIVDTEPDATLDGDTATWNIGDLAVNETVNLTIRVKVDESAAAGTSFDDHVLARGKCDGRDVEQPDDVNDLPEVVDDFSGPCDVGFSNKDASHIQVTEGQTFSYYVHAFNSGAEPCTGVSVTDTLDERLEFVSCNKGCTNSGQSVSWDIDEIPGGSSVIFSVVVSVRDDATGRLANTAIIDPDNGDPKTVDTSGPEIGDQSIPKDPTSASRGPVDMPRTGTSIPAGIAMGLGAAALALFALRRRTAIA